MSVTGKYRAQGYNCAETIIKAFNEEYGTDLPVRAATAFGGGLSCGGVCGAAAGAVMALGLLCGRDEGTEPNRAGKYAREFMSRMRERYGSLDCRDLKAKGIACNELVEEAYGILKDCADKARAEEV